LELEPLNTNAEIEVPSAPLRAQANGDGGGLGGILGSPIFFLVAMLLLMWALLIRPQQRKEKEHKAMLAQVEKGDSIITTGGLHGKVTGIADDVLTVEISPNVRVKLSRGAIASRASGKAEGDKS
jgi:preprotein translocase subunit YajC